MRAILKEFEQLCVQKDRVEKLMKALEMQIDLTDQSHENKCAKKTVHLPNCTVVTRLKVL